MGEIDYDDLGRRLAANKGRPAIINVNIGTTVKGAVDNLDRRARANPQTTGRDRPRRVAGDCDRVVSGSLF